MKGTIKNLDAEKGYGFITGTNGGEYFFHKSGLVGVTMGDLRKGDGVTFSPEDSEKGPRAEDVSRQ